MRKNLKSCSALNRTLALVMAVCILLLEISGCGPAWKKKFIRKSKKKKNQQVFVYKQREYQKPPNAEIYQKYFVFWKSWHRELINKLGENKRRSLRMFEETISSLETMRGLLDQKKAGELEGFITTLKGYQDKYKSEEFTDVRSRQMRTRLNRLMLRIDKKFRYSRVKGLIR